MRKFTLFICIILLLVLTSCKMGVDGETFLAYSWPTMPQYIYDNNPSTPSLIRNGEYFRTNVGSYYFEYTAWDGSDYWGTYAIKAEPGQLFVDGSPTYFEITLYSFGPSIYKWSSPRTIGSESKNREDGHKILSINGYTIELQWGAIDSESSMTNEGIS